MTGAAAPPALPPWRQRDYMLLWSGMCVSTLGSNAAGIVYPLLVLALTGSPETVGWVTALRSTPFVLLALPVGAMVDRWDRRRVMLTCDVARAFVVGSLPLGFWLAEPSLTHIVAVAVIEGTLGVFYNLAEVAALPRVVPRWQLPQATAQNHAGFAAAGVAGPAFGTWLYQVGRGLPMAFDAISYVVSAFTLWRLRGDFSAVPSAAPRDLWAEVRAGLRWLWHERLVRIMSLLTGGLNFVGAAVPLLLIVLAQQQGATASEIGLIFSLGGVGGVLGAVVGSRLQQRFSFGRVIFVTVLLQALLFPFYAVAPGPLALGLVCGLIQFIGPIYNVTQLSHRLALIPPGLEGRVNAGFRFIAHLPNPIGAALCGLTIERLGTGWTLAGFGLMFGLLAVVAGSSRTIRHAPRVTGIDTAPTR